MLFCRLQLLRKVWCGRESSRNIHLVCKAVLTANTIIRLLSSDLRDLNLRAQTKCNLQNNSDSPAYSHPTQVLLGATQTPLNVAADECQL